ncbi:DUF1254 domain-containing protein [Novosphingobium sp. KCTC 2891]|uniref:DUF1254 domain-containing protein n=1 Tax=Novosphingobium sp. KCTC 2891 TaxID=2989730 RepID=UPI002221F270|nr:DUF1254 domain-containing protein [Novosphingobium sp. KCTC 2891]MCW1381814.1 DUF1254 domain-containing protein [Novosphingobium sp. KCTC 2891]
MSRRLALALVFIAAMVVGHVGTIVAAPHAIMAVAMNRLSQSGEAVNRFHFARRTTAQSRAIVRPSPDLAYASCVYDLADGPLLVTAAPTPAKGYVSVSVFAGNTDNIGVFDSLRAPEGIRFVLAPAGQVPDPAKMPTGLPVLYSPSRKGVILDRRLAPTAEAFAVADKARREDRCAPLR